MSKTRTPGQDWVAGYKAALTDVSRLICIRLSISETPVALANVVSDLRNDAAVILHEIENKAQRANLRAAK